MIQLSDNDVRGSLTWRKVLGALESAFRGSGGFQTPERVALRAPAGGKYLTMPCADAEGWFGVKQVSVLPDNATQGRPTVQAWYTLFNPHGEPALACSATLLTRARTAAVSALAARYLAPAKARTLLAVGTGSLAPWMVEAHLQVRPYERVLVWGRDEKKARATAADIETRFADADVRPSILPVADLAEAVSEADVVTVATTARKPIIEGRWLRSGQHLDLVGAFVPEMAEADAEAVKRADVFVDDREAAGLEAGDLIQAQAQGWSFDEVYGDLHELVAGRVQRLTPARTTLFKSVGLAFEDLVVAKLLLEHDGMKPER